MKLNMKKIFGFKVCINDKIICGAGFENANSVVSCILNSVRRKNDNSEELDISIGGLNSDNNEHVDWYNNRLRKGDIISIEIISDDFDTPTKIRKKLSEKEIIAQKLEYFHKLREELKEHLEK